MIQYQDLIRRILDAGEDVPDRTGTGTRSIFGHQMRFDLQEGFPLVTTKRTFFRGAFEEMLWILRGETSVFSLQRRGVRIWDKWASDHGELGPIYGHQWREWGTDFDIPFGGVDQIAELIDGLRDNPHSRRHIVTAWNPSQLPRPGLEPHYQAEQGLMALAPCHCLVQFHVSAAGRLSCQLYQRSADVFLGVPFNIASYALLTHLIAHHLGYWAGDFIWTGGDCHLYQNHLEKAEELLTRDLRPLPELHLFHPQETSIWDVTFDDLGLIGYDPHPPIKAEVSV